MGKQLQVILFILFIIAIICAVISRKYKKEDLAKHYKVSRPTLQNWAKFFPIIIPADKWKSKRLLTSSEFLKIKEQWGDDSKMVLSKKQMVLMAETNYKALGENVKKNLEKIGLSLEAWESCSIFPPVISQRILAVLG